MVVDIFYVVIVHIFDNLNWMKRLKAAILVLFQTSKDGKNRAKFQEIKGVSLVQMARKIEPS